MTRLSSYAAMGAFLAVTAGFWPADLLRPDTTVSVRHVVFCGWLTALSTGLGAVPFFFVPTLDGERFAALSNCVAAGMMLAASAGLALEGVEFDGAASGDGGRGVRPRRARGAFGVAAPPAAGSVAVGALLGLAFVAGAKRLIECAPAEATEAPLSTLVDAACGGVKAKQVALIILVMTVHSAAEGIGIGVSFGGANGARARARTAPYRRARCLEFWPRARAPPLLPRRRDARLVRHGEPRGAQRARGSHRRAHAPPAASRGRRRVVRGSSAARSLQ